MISRPSAHGEHLAPNRPPVVLIVAGSDPLSGAGAVADALTARELRAHPLVVLSAFVDQDSHGTRAWSRVSDQVFIAQLTAAWRDGSPDAVKVGMLGDAARAEQLAEVIESTAGSGIRGFVIDPVLAAGVDDQSLASSALPPAIVRLAVRLARSHLVVLTPNVPELSALLRAPPARDFPELVSGAQALHRLTGAAVLATGGHLKEDTGTDVLVSDAETSRFECAVWPAADDVHGTGCCLSTAIAARLACGDTLEDSVRVGRGALLDKVENAVRIGNGRRQVGPSTEP